MFVKLRRAESIQTFNIWVYGEGSLARGSGLYVGENGVTCNHHFLLPADGTKFEFLPGEYKVEVYASLVGVKQPLLLYVTGLSVAEQVPFGRSVGIFYRRKFLWVRVEQSDQPDRSCRTYAIAIRPL